MEAGGMAPVDVLLATTRSAAELMGIADEVGSLEPASAPISSWWTAIRSSSPTCRSGSGSVYKSGMLVAGAA